MAGYRLCITTFYRFLIVTTARFAAVNSGWYYILNIDANKHLMDSLSLAAGYNPQPLEVAEVSANSS
ncbi:hypothetical protein [Bradyrhizobium sp. 188]|uniref:hypothetical protein n=1 Tax=Bradyrhizobium sp. 188 TaxID=2782656 RepID=UPI001FF7C551|nr:hypothetical protein [Bradyrhizobium sp. 188]MCK1501751.1 hypothetical protein [Bradyrhizobium sp. 188]